MRCKVRKLPLESHQASAWAPKRSISSGSTVPLVSRTLPNLISGYARLDGTQSPEKEYVMTPSTRQYGCHSCGEWTSRSPPLPGHRRERSMSRIVQKFGGTSLADVDLIKNVARRISGEVEIGNEVAVVVSAMAGVTNQLIDWTRETSRVHDAREYDVVVSSGEQVTAGLLALALQDLGVDARSWLGWQIPVRTDGVHGKARIETIDVAELRRRLARGQVAVVAGFQGIGPRGRITTLGRGGSDTSAVALAAALEADRCDIFTDVDGVYTSDPRIVAKARKLGRITYEEMLEMAMNHRVRVQVLSSFTDTPGTLVIDEDEIVEQRVVSGIAYSRDEAKITVEKVA